MKVQETSSPKVLMPRTSEYLFPCLTQGNKDPDEFKVLSSANVWRDRIYWITRGPSIRTRVSSSREESKTEGQTNVGMKKTIAAAEHG